METNKIQKLSRTDKAWINGFFAGFESGQKDTFLKMKKYCKKQLKHIRKVDIGTK